MDSIIWFSFGQFFFILFYFSSNLKLCLSLFFFFCFLLSLLNFEYNKIIETRNKHRIKNEINIFFWFYFILFFSFTHLKLSDEMLFAMRFLTRNFFLLNWNCFNCLIRNSLSKNMISFFYTVKLLHNTWVHFS